MVSSPPAEETEIKNARPGAGVLDVYVAAIPENFTPVPLPPPERGREIMAPRNETLRRERCAVWTLLLRALERSMKLRADTLRFEKLPEGKWVCDQAFFSLSHAGGAVAVAVSDAPVGVDLECEEEFFSRFRNMEKLERLERKVCTPAEFAAIQSVSDFLALWTKKESIFKCVGGTYFDPAATDTAAHATVTRSLPLPERYTVSVCSAQVELLRWIREQL